MLPLTMLILVRKSCAWSEILLVVLTEFRSIEEARVSHTLEGVILKHRVEIKGLWLIRPLESWALELLLKLGAEDPVEILKVRSLIVGRMTEIHVIVGKLLSILSTTVILLHVVPKLTIGIDLVSKVDS